MTRLLALCVLVFTIGCGPVFGPSPEQTDLDRARAIGGAAGALCARVEKHPEHLPALTIAIEQARAALKTEAPSTVLLDALKFIPDDDIRIDAVMGARFLLALFGDPTGDMLSKDSVLAIGMSELVESCAAAAGLPSPPEPPSPE